MPNLINSVANVNFTDAIGGVLPATDDFVYVTQGFARYTAGLDLSGSSVDLAGVIFGRGRTVGIGDQGTRLKFKADRTSAGYLLNQLGGSGQKVMVESVSVTTKIAKVHNDTSGSNTLDVATALVEKWFNMNGYGLVRGTCDVEKLYASGGVVDVYEKEGAVTILDEVHVSGGASVILRRDATQIDVYHGKLTIDDALVTPAAAGNLVIRDTCELLETPATLALTLDGGAVLDVRRIKNPCAITCTTYGRPRVLVSRSNPVAVTFTETANGLGLVEEPS